jgi:hypothetical protein
MIFVLPVVKIYNWKKASLRPNQALKLTVAS